MLYISHGIMKMNNILGAVSKFLSKKGHNQGAGSEVYQKAYIFLEKLRIANNEPKSSLRKKNEKKVPNGFPLDSPRKELYYYITKSSNEK